MKSFYDYLVIFIYVLIVVVVAYFLFDESISYAETILIYNTLYIMLKMNK